MARAATTTTAEVQPLMDHSPEPVATEDRKPDSAASGSSSGRLTRPSSDAVTNTLMGVIGAAFLGVLIFALTETNARITRLENNSIAGFAALDAKIDTRIDRLDTKIDELDTRLTKRIDELDGKIDALALQMTALVAALQASGMVDAALDGSPTVSDDAVG